MIFIFNKTIKLWRFEFIIDWRSKKSRMGRFGGGWNWKVGFQIGETTIILHLLILSIIISYKKYRRATK